MTNGLNRETGNNHNTFGTVITRIFMYFLTAFTIIFTIQWYNKTTRSNKIGFWLIFIILAVVGYFFKQL